MSRPTDEHHAEPSETNPGQTPDDGPLHRVIEALDVQQEIDEPPPPHLDSKAAEKWGVRVTTALGVLALVFVAASLWFVLRATVLAPAVDLEADAEAVSSRGRSSVGSSWASSRRAMALHLQLRRDPVLASKAGDTIYRLGPTGPLGLVWTVMPALAGFVLLASLTPLTSWLLANPGLGLALYVSVFVIAAGLGLLPTYAQAIVGGWIFGPHFGWPVAIAAALTGFTGASVVGYYVSVRIGGHRVEKLIDEHPRWGAVRRALLGGGFLKTLCIVTLVRVPPNSPFALTNLLLSTAGVRLAPYALGTAIGMTPRTAAAVILATLAAQEGEQNLSQFIDAAKRNPVLVVLAVGGTVLALGVVAYIANRTLNRLGTGRN